MYIHVEPQFKNWIAFGSFLCLMIEHSKDRDNIIDNIITMRTTLSALLQLYLACCSAWQQTPLTRGVSLAWLQQRREECSDAQTLGHPIQSPFADQQLPRRGRRDFLLGVTAAATTSSMFVASGSAAANDKQQQLVKLEWYDKEIGHFPVAVNGINRSDNVAVAKEDDNDVVLTYNNEKSAKRILVYQKTGSSKESRLIQAQSEKVAIARTLDIGERLDIQLSNSLKKKSTRVLQTSTRQPPNAGGSVYYEFDVATEDNLYYLSVKRDT